MSLTTLDDIEINGVESDHGGIKTRQMQSSKKIKRDGFSGELHRDNSIDVAKKRASVLLHMHEMQIFGLRGNPVVVAGAVVRTIVA